MNTHTSRTVRRHRRAAALVAAALAAAALLSACTSAHPSAASSPTTQASAPSSPTAAAPSPTASAAPAPVFGLAAAWPGGAGFGAVKPPTVDRAGDGTSVMSDITWSSWGGAQAVGTGTAVYVAPGQSNAEGTSAPATIVAWDLGTCAGKPAYLAYNWYFPSHGGKLDTTKYFSTCDRSHLGL